MFPILLQFGSVTIYALWVFLALGFFATLLVLHRLIQKDRAKLTFIADHSLAIFFAGLIVSRLAFIIRNIDYFSKHLSEIFFIWDKGLSIWGGIIGIILALIYFCRKNHENTLRWLDILIISVLAGFVWGNVGAFMDGRNYGKETNLPWGVIIESSRYAVPIHPTQIYAAIYCLLLTIILYQLYFHEIGKKEGRIAYLGVISYAVLRFIDEFLRGDESNYFLGLREAQIYCLLAIIAAGVVWYVRHKKGTPQKKVTEGLKEQSQ